MTEDRQEILHIFEGVVKANKRLLNNKATDRKVLNIGGRNWISVNDLIEILRSITGSTSDVINSSKQKGDAGLLNNIKKG